MDKYRKLKAIQGLIVSLDEQIYRYDQGKQGPIHSHHEKTIVEEYFQAVKELLLDK